MAEESLNVMQSQSDGVAKDDNDEGQASQEILGCTRLNLSENIEAYVKNKTLVRKQTKQLICNNSLIDKVVSNYIIAKQIISNLSWQDKLLCKHVCSTWHSAVQSLKKEQLSPEDFVIDFTPCSTNCNARFRRSGNFNTEPLVVITFANNSGYIMSSNCELIYPYPCTQPCNKKHSLLDVVHKFTSAPKDCHFIVKADYLSYMPLSCSKTKQHTITRLDTKPFIGGLYLPDIPNVQFQTIDIKRLDIQEFYTKANKIVENKVIKGIIVFVNEIFLLLSMKDILFLKYFKRLQPDVPYALGGCIVSDTVLEQIDFNGILQAVNNSEDFISGSLLSIGLFTVPKDMEAHNYFNFDMYSLILKSSEWSKAKIRNSISEFSQQVPRFEHSAAIKFSCVGRDQKHKFEQDCFRTSFPDTRIVGCYGNGELGYNHPEQPQDDQHIKKIRKDPQSQFGLIYSYSSVFVYIGWGKITSDLGPVQK